MAKSASNGSAPDSSAFWERLYNIFARDRGGGSGHADEPSRRGIIIAICILVSGLLWFTFSMRETYTATLQMPTEVTNVPEGEALLEMPPPTIEADVEGEGLSLIRLRLDPPVISIDGSQREVQVRETVAEALKSVQLQDVTPASLSLEKQERVTRTVPIVSKVDVRTSSTYDLLAEPRLTPDSVKISGAASIVDRIFEWPTEELELTNVRDTLRARVPLDDTLSGLVSRSIDATTLTAVSKRFTEGEREIEVEVTGEPATEQLVTLDPAKITVRYRVLLDEHDEAETAMDFFATVSYEEIRRDTTGEITPELHMPADVELRDVEMIPSSLSYYQRLR